MNTSKAQRGFFDLGISLIILALGGTTVALKTMDNNVDTISTAQSQQVISAKVAINQNERDYDFDC